MDPRNPELKNLRIRTDFFADFFMFPLINLKSPIPSNNIFNRVLAHSHKVQHSTFAYKASNSTHLDMSPLRFLLVAVVAAVVGAFGVGKTSRYLKTTALNANIIETAEKAGNFNTFVKLVKSAGLDGALSANGLTVFAPTDEAFAKIPAEILESLAGDAATLSSVLQFHVHPGVMNPTRTGRTINTLLVGADTFPKQLTIKVTNWECEAFVFAGQATPAKVTTMGIKCDNGLIHEITEVLLPYEGDLPPSVTFIGMGGIKMGKTLQLSYYGSQEGTGKAITGDMKEKYDPISVGTNWKKAGNWDNAIGYFDEAVEYHKRNSVEYNKEKNEK